MHTRLSQQTTALGNGSAATLAESESLTNYIRPRQQTTALGNGSAATLARPES